MVNAPIFAEESAITLAVVLRECAVPVVTIAPMVYSLSMAATVLGLSDIEIPTLVVKAPESVGQFLGFLRTNGKLFVVLYKTGNETTFEAVIDMVAL